MVPQRVRDVCDFRACKKIGFLPCPTLMYLLLASLAFFLALPMALLPCLVALCSNVHWPERPLLHNRTKCPAPLPQASECHTHRWELLHLTLRQQTQLKPRKNSGADFRKAVFYCLGTVVLEGNLDSCKSAKARTSLAAVDKRRLPHEP